MGCDIHLYIEYKRPKYPQWHPFGGKINPGRIYGMFGLLSKGVRTEYPESMPPRGIPSDISWTAQSDNRLFISDSGEDGTATIEAAEKWGKYGKAIIRNDAGEPIWVEHPDWHSHSWLTAAEFENVLSLFKAKGGYDNDEYSAVLACLKSFVSSGCEARVVFWFDN